jgi:hypothetical protein
MMHRCSSRRAFLTASSLGFGWLACQDLLNRSTLAASQSMLGRPHFAPRAKHIILCYMSGGVSSVDSFDPKPLLDGRAGDPMPVPVKATMFDNVGTIMPSPWKFRPRGESGLPVSDLFPAIARHADDLCVIRSMTSKASEHAQGNFHFHSGFSFQGYPSAGAWMSYGLGTENENLPGYVVLRSGKAKDPIGGKGIYSSGFLPAQHQASFLAVDKDPPLPNLQPSEPAPLQRKRMATMRQLDRWFLRDTAGEQKVEAAIANYETAFRMQSAVPEACDLSDESEATRRRYAIDSSDSQEAGFALQCLAARRLVERGVRFIELSCLPRIAGSSVQAINPWDQHDGLEKGHALMARQVDRPIAGLLSDLKSRGLLDSTIVIFSGEFGRTPFAQGSDGRDHNPYGFSLWVAGGGFRGGTAFGATDEFGYHAIENPLSVYDLWATVQHQMGIDHERSTYHFGGRDFRLSDVEGHVIRELID